MRDGEAIEQCLNSVQLDFKLHESSKGARKKFVRRYKEASTTLSKGDIELTSALVKKMEDGKIWNGYEDTWFWFLKSELSKVLQNDKAHLNSLRRATGSKEAGEFLGADTYLGMLKQQFILEIKASLFNDALATFARIEQLPDSESVTQVLGKYAIKVKKIVKEQPYFLVNAEISTEGMWWHRLSHNGFSFSDIQGEIDAVELRCANKREKYTVVEGNEWIIPQSWGRCSMMVLGDPTATFNLLEIKQDA